MNSILRVIRKDARALRLLWLLWILVIAAQVCVASRILHREAPLPNAFVGEAAYFNVLGAAWVIFGYLLAAATVLQDPPVGTRAFWTTRPISGGQMLAAKAIGILIFLVVTPALVWLPWRLYCSFSAADLISASMGTMTIAGAAVVPAVLLAALAGDGPRFLLYNLVGAAVFVTSVMIVAGSYGDVPTGLISSRLMLGTAVLLAWALALIVGRYLKRWRRTAAVVALFGAAACVAIAACWPWDLTAHFRAAPAPLANSDRITTNVFVSAPSAKNNSEGDFQVLVYLDLKGAPSDLALLPSFADVELAWPDGSRFSKSDAPMAPEWWDAQQEAVIDRTLGTKHWHPDSDTSLKMRSDPGHRGREQDQDEASSDSKRGVPGTDDFRYFITLDLPATSANKLRTGTASATVTATVRYARPRLLFVLPFRQGASGSGGGVRARVVSEQDLFENSNQSHSVAESIISDHSPRTNLRFYTTDSLYDGAGNSDDFKMDLGGFESLGYEHLKIKVPLVWRTDRWTEIPGWVDGVRVFAVNLEDAGGFVRTIRTTTHPAVKDP